MFDAIIQYAAVKVETDRGSVVQVAGNYVIVDRPSTHPSGSKHSEYDLSKMKNVTVHIKITDDLSQYIVYLSRDHQTTNLGRYTEITPAILLSAAIMQRIMYIVNE